MSVNQSSEKQRAASRANGAKSTGPVSVEGRARSSRNSLRHGLCSEVVVLPHEDRGAFEALRDSYMDDFQAANQSQHDLVETMAAARWRLNRLVEMEAKIFEEEVIMRRKEMDKELIEMTEVEKLAWVFGHMANHGKSLPLLIRYEGSLNRSYERAYKQLKELQDRAQSHPCAAPNVPEPLAPTPLPAPPRNEPNQEPQECESNPAQPPAGPSNPPPAPKTGPDEPQEA